METFTGSRTRVVLPEEARVIRAFGDEMILHLSKADTGGRFTMWTNVTPPGGGPPPALPPP